jgi:phosphonate transport system permease protein
LLESRHLLTVILLGAFLWSLLSVDWTGRVIHAGGVNALRELGSAIVSPDLSPEVLRNGLQESWRTVSYAVAGLTVALVLGFPLGVVASGVLAWSPWQKRASAASVRFLLAFFRSIHELVWAWLFVAALGLSPMAAVLALGIPYGGILGRIYSEILQDVPEGPLRSLRHAGASEWRVFWYGRLPMALPDIISYTFYRLECGIRSAAILSFIGLGGLGHRIQLALADLDYSQAWSYVLFLVALVLVVDIWSSLVRRRMA